MAANTTGIIDKLGDVQDQQKRLLDAVGGSRSSLAAGENTVTNVSAYKKAIASAMAPYLNLGRYEVDGVAPQVVLDFSRQVYAFGEVEADDIMSVGGVVKCSRNTEGTVVNSAGVLETVPSYQPRITHDPKTGECLGILAEYKATNYCTGSEMAGSDLSMGSDTSWDMSYRDNYRGVPLYQYTKGSVSYSDFSFPHKLVTGSVFYRDLGEDSNSSIMLRVEIRNDVALKVNYISRISEGVFELANSENSRLHVEDWGGGYYRLGLTMFYTGEEVPTTIRIAVYGNNKMLGGFQIENNEVMTSYIKTDGAAVTRDSESINVSGSYLIPLLNGAEYTVYAEAIQKADIGSFFAVRDGTTSIRVGVPTNNNTTLNGITLGLPTYFPHVVAKELNKAAIASDVSKSIVSVNGETAHTAAYPSIGRISSISLGTLGGSNNSIDGTIKEFRIYRTALSDARVKMLTSVEDRE